MKRWTVWYHLLGMDPEQLRTVDVIALGPIEAEDRAKEKYGFSYMPYIVSVYECGTDRYPYKR